LVSVMIHLRSWVRHRASFVTSQRKGSTTCERTAQRRAARRPDDQLATVADPRGERGEVVFEARNS